MYNSNTAGGAVRLFASLNTRRKLKVKHNVSMGEVRQCFKNRSGGFLEDTRAEHATFPATLWFIAPTDSGRMLKVVFMEQAGPTYEIKTAYEPNEEEERIHAKYS
jgi:hypothetical protein